jgi:hypothetical protein
MKRHEEIDMLLHLPIAILLTLSPIPVSGSVPQFDIARECHFEGGSTATVDRCSEDEGAALLDLRQAWARFGGADKRNCTVEATTSGFASYVELLTCLEMAGGPQTTEATRLHAPGVTVGVGHDPISPGQMPSPGGR